MCRVRAERCEECETRSATERAESLVSVTDWKNTDGHSMSQLLSTQPRPLIGQLTVKLASDWPIMIQETSRKQEITPSSQDIGIKVL